MKIRPPVALAATAALAAAALAVQPPTPAAAGDRAPSGTRAVLEEYMADSWDSMAAMTDESTGLPADNIGGDLDASTRSGYTSPTNIGAYLWSTVVARDTGLISRREARERARTTIETVAGMEKHEPSGMFYNWYDPATGAKLDDLPGGGDHRAVRLQRRQRLARDRPAPDRAGDPGAEARRPRRSARRWTSATTTTRPRASGRSPAATAAGRRPDPRRLLGRPAVRLLGRGQLPRRRGRLLHLPPLRRLQHRAPHRLLPRHRRRPDPGQALLRHAAHLPADLRLVVDRDQADRRVAHLRGRRRLRGHAALPRHRLVPTWGGSMFEALMVPLFVPEETWGARSWGVNHPLYVQAQIEHGMDEAGYGYWGFSPSNNPAGGYREYGVDQLGIDGPGYTSDQERTSWEQPYEGCPDRAGTARPDGVRRRGGDPARVLPRPALRARPGAGQPRQAAGGLRRLRPRRLLRRRRRPHRARSRRSTSRSTRAWSSPPSATPSPATPCAPTSAAAHCADKVRPLMEQEVFTSQAR